MLKYTTELVKVSFISYFCLKYTDYLNFSYLRQNET